MIVSFLIKLTIIIPSVRICVNERLTKSKILEILDESDTKTVEILVERNKNKNYNTKVLFYTGFELLQSEDKTDHPLIFTI